MNGLCTSCGTALNADTALCTGCGAPAGAADQPARKNRKWPWILGLILFFTFGFWPGHRMAPPCPACPVPPTAGTGGAGGGGGGDECWARAAKWTAAAVAVLPVAVPEPGTWWAAALPTTRRSDPKHHWRLYAMSEVQRSH